MKTSFQSRCTRELASLRRGATFLSVQHYINNFGEVSNFSICFHVSYQNALQKAIDLLHDYEPTAQDCVDKPYSPGHLASAKFELLDSHKMSLSGNNPLATSAHAYDAVVDHDRQPIDGIKLHREQDILHLWGFLVHKVVLIPGQYPPDNRHLLTRAKDDLRAMTPLGNFRQFKLGPAKFEKFVVQGITIREEDCIREYSSKIMKKAWAND